MDLLDLGSVVSAIQAVKDERERESWGIMLLCTWAINMPIAILYSLGRGIELKSPFFKWLGYVCTHGAGTIYKTAMQQTFTHRMVIAAPKELTENTALLDAIHVEQIVNKKPTQ
jgi:hypothetical protein